MYNEKKPRPPLKNEQKSPKSRQRASSTLQIRQRYRMKKTTDKEESIEYEKINQKNTIFLFLVPPLSNFLQIEIYEEWVPILQKNIKDIFQLYRSIQLIEKICTTFWDYHPSDLTKITTTIWFQTVSDEVDGKIFDKISKGRKKILELVDEKNIKRNKDNQIKQLKPVLQKFNQLLAEMDALSTRQAKLIKCCQPTLIKLLTASRYIKQYRYIQRFPLAPILMSLLTKIFGSQSWRLQKAKEILYKKMDQNSIWLAETSKENILALSEQLFKDYLWRKN